MLTRPYVAGLFDADGCVTIIRAKRGKTIRHVLRVDISNCYAPVIEALKAQFGGTMVRRSLAGRKKRDPNEYGIRDSYTWISGAANAARFLRILHPYLIVKREEAEVGLKFQARLSKTRKGRSVDGIELQKRDHLADLCSSLKRRRYDLNGLSS